MDSLTEPFRALEVTIHADQQVMLKCDSGRTLAPVTGFTAYIRG